MTHSHVSLLLLHYPLQGSSEFMLSRPSHLSSIYYHQALDKYQGDKKALMEEIHRESLVDENDEFDDEINASACQGSDKHFATSIGSEWVPENHIVNGELA